jgi:hypothetical protein
MMRPLPPPWIQASDTEGPKVEPGTVIWTRPDSTAVNLAYMKVSVVLRGGTSAHKLELWKIDDAKARLTRHTVRYAALQRFVVV